jgi:hypothetical protein
MEARTKSRMFCLYQCQVIESGGKDQTDGGDAIRIFVLVYTLHYILRYHVCSKSKCVENIVPFVLHVEFGGSCWVRKNHQDRGRRGTFESGEVY